MNPPERTSPQPGDLAESIRSAVIRAGEAAYEDAGIQGLCAEGRWEAAVSAMRAVELDSILRSSSSAGDPKPSPAAETPSPPA